MRVGTAVLLLCLLLLGAQAARRPRYDNLALGVPGRADAVIEREGYALGYSRKYGQALWVIYRMTREEVLAKSARRENDFREDYAVPTGRTSPEDYAGTGYDRGHLAPAADMAFSHWTLSESFYMSNMSPQKPAFNRGVWRRLEEQIRQFAADERDIYVVTGPIFSADETLTVIAGRIAVPTHYYKVVYDRTPPEKMIGFILPNEGSVLPLWMFAVTVDAVEAATGLDFFSAVPQPRQEELESVISIHDWRWKQK